MTKPAPQCIPEGIFSNEEKKKHTHTHIQESMEKSKPHSRTVVKQMKKWEILKRYKISRTKTPIKITLTHVWLHMSLMLTLGGKR